ncbi:helix-turn-helix transcriptional regulator [bacterium]|nr:helix-turn-helix transcriptional regulator [bacterium]
MRRKELGISQQELALRMGTSSSGIHNYERCKVVPSVERWTAWRHAVGLPALLFRSDEAHHRWRKGFTGDKR